jgi:hypothetical protein
MGLSDFALRLIILPAVGIGMLLLFVVGWWYVQRKTSVQSNDQPNTDNSLENEYHTPRNSLDNDTYHTPRNSLVNDTFGGGKIKRMIRRRLLHF